MNYTLQGIAPSASATNREIFTLNNGLRVVIQEDHFAPVVAIQMWVKAGSADETPDVAGAAHVHEHMIFKGTARRPVGAIAAEVESSGGQINAFTTADHTVYHLVLASRYFTTGLDILADALHNTAFDPHELSKELHVVMEEWKRGEDSPTSRAATELFRLVYSTHPYGRPVIGFRETIEALNRERVLNFYQRWYHPNNMTLVIVGDVDREEAHREIVKLFVDRPVASLPTRPRDPEPPQRSMRLSVLDMNVEEFYLYLAFPIPSAKHKDVFALDILSYILGGGESSRLVQNLQADRELVNWIVAHAYTPQDAGMFIVSAALEHDKINATLEGILAEMFRSKQELVSPAELARARMNLESDFVYRRETVQGQARQLGYFLTVFDDSDYERVYLDGLANVTLHDVRAVAQRYLTPEALSTVLLGATTDVTIPSTEDIQALCRRLDTPQLSPTVITPAAAAKKEDAEVALTVLDNGIRILVKEHHGVPVMSIQTVMFGGLLFENDQNIGINNFLSGMLTRGSERFSRLGLAEAVESVAGSLRGFSGRNSVGLSGSFLTTSRIDNALALFLETLLHPTFPEDEVEKRRREILLALKNREDELAQIAFELFYGTVFSSHPYRLPLLGTEDTVRTMARADMAEYYRLLLNPQRLVVSIVGDVDTSQVVQQLRASLESLTVPSHILAFPPHESRPETGRQQRKTVEKQQAHIVLGFQGVSLAHPDRYALKVLDAVLSRQGGRLFYEVREQRALAYSVTAFSMEGVAPGVFGIYLGTDPSKVEEAISAARSELAQLRESLVSPEELEQAKKYLTGSYEISLQSNGAQSEELAFNELYGLGYDNSQRYLAALQKVTAEDLRRVAQTYFAADTETLVIVGR
ncbi:MAG: M16 family metallopeptidase [Candidatus Binatia bacterium]